MSAPIVSQSAAVAGPGYPIRARVAAGVARLLSLLPPGVICKVLMVLAKGTRRADPSEVLSWRNAVNAVSRRCAGAGCLQRSIAVMVLARSFGAAPTWRTGLRPDPFVAHAWVAVDDVPIGEPAAVSHFRTVLEVVPKHRPVTANSSAERFPTASRTLLERKSTQ